MQHLRQNPPECLIVIDLEATCWEHETTIAEMEIIEIGAVKLDIENAFAPLDQFTTFVQPQLNPTLSAFCQDLTSIRQADVDQAPMFPAAFRALIDWIGPASYLWGSWGNYDAKQFAAAFVQHNVTAPAAFRSHVNLKAVHKTLLGHKRQMGMTRTLESLGLPLTGAHHRGLDDAQNIGRIVQHLATRPDFLPTLLDAVSDKHLTPNPEEGPPA